MPVGFRFDARTANKDLLNLKRGLRGKILTAAADAIGKQGVKELKKAAPRSKTGVTENKHLKDSFSYKVSTRHVVRFISDRLYAVMVSKGTKSSVGGYVPFLGARLSKRVAKNKKLVSKKLKHHPGVKATKYIEKAATQLRLKAERVVMAELKRRGFIKGGKFVIPNV